MTIFFTVKLITSFNGNQLRSVNFLDGCWVRYGNLEYFWYDVLTMPDVYYSNSPEANPKIILTACFFNAMFMLEQNLIFLSTVYIYIIV